MMQILHEPVLETERLILRKIHNDDVDDVQEIYNQKEMFLYTNSDVDINANSFCINKDLAFVMIESWENNKEQLCWGIELKSKKLIGRVYLYNFIGNPISGYRADIGFSLSLGYWEMVIQPKL